MDRRAAGASPVLTATRRRKRCLPAPSSLASASGRLPLPPGCGVPASEVLNQRVALEDVWGAKAHAWPRRCDAAREPDALMAALENAVARRTPPAGSRPATCTRHSNFCRPAHRLENRWSRGLAANLALSERTLRRRFDMAFGYGPKTLDRILRFQRFLKLVRSADRISAADFAAETGYADQAHLDQGKPPAGRQHAGSDRRRCSRSAGARTNATVATARPRSNERASA